MKKLLFVSLFLGGLISVPDVIAAEQIDVPHLSDFQQISPQDGTFSFSAQYPKDAISAAQEYNTKANSDNPIRIVAEIKIDDYEWQSCRVHSADMLEENKTFDSEIARKLQSEGTVLLRIKIIDNKEQFPETDWSNILSINAKGPEFDEEEYEEADEAVSDESGTETMPAAKAKKTRRAKYAKQGNASQQSCLLNKEICCKQLMGLSVCVWQIIAASIFVILLIIYRKIAIFALIIILLAVLFLFLRNDGKDRGKQTDLSTETTATQSVQTERNTK